MSERLDELRQQYGCGPVQFSGADEALYNRHLLFDDVIDPFKATPRAFQRPDHRGLCAGENSRDEVCRERAGMRALKINGADTLPPDINGPRSPFFVWRVS